MNRPQLLGEASIPGSDRKLRLFQGKDDCTITITRGGELMSTRKHASEDALATLPCSMLNNTESASVLIGGLGMGFTLAAALNATGAGARVQSARTWKQRGTTHNLGGHNHRLNPHIRENASVGTMSLLAPP